MESSKESEKDVSADERVENHLGDSTDPENVVTENVEKTAESIESIKPIPSNNLPNTKEDLVVFEIEELSVDNENSTNEDVKVFESKELLNSLKNDIVAIENGDGHEGIHEEVDGEEENPESGDGSLVETEEVLNEGTKQVYILSSAGKPVYRWRGSEDKLVTLFGVMQALVSVVQDVGDTIQSVHAGNTVIVFLVKGPIILVSVNPRGESIEFLQNQLTYVYNQIVSVLTLSQLTRIFEERHNYDLRRLLDGSERLIDHLLCFTETQPEFLLDSVSCLDMSQSARDTISNTLVKCCNKRKIVFALLLGNNKIITIVRMKKYKMKPCDTHLLLSLITSSESFKAAESWTPICLPDFNPSGYLLAHISYICDVPACLILLTAEPGLFFSLSDTRKQIVDELTVKQCNIVLRDALKKQPITMDQIKLKNMQHFIYKCKTTSQIFYPVWPGNAEDPEELIKLYEQLHSKINHRCQPLKFYYQVRPKHVMFGWSAEKFELYICFEPHISKAVCIDRTNKLLEWIKKQEDRLFMQHCMTI